MSEETVDPNSKTSLFKRWLKLVKADTAKGAAAYSTLLNWGFMALALYMQIIVPAISLKEDPQIATLKADLTNAVEAKEVAEALAIENRKGFEAVKQDAAKLSLDLDACRADPPAKELKPAEKHEASLTPPITKVRVKKTPVVKPVDPTLYEQFVAWLETQNVGAPQ